MAQFTVNPDRFDPYKHFKFRVKWDNRYIAGVASVSGLVRTTKVIEYRSGNESSVTRKSPGQTLFAPIILTRGRTHDDEFERWANQVWGLGGAGVALKTFRKNIVIELQNEAGQIVMAFKVYRCWPAEYTALGALDANESCVAWESLTLQHEGWERDQDIPEPTEPSAQ